VQVSGTNVDATDPSAQQEPDVWYTWIAPVSGPVKISAQSGTRAPQLEIYLDGSESDFQASALGEPPDFPITDFGCEPPRFYCDHRSVQAGQVYRIRAFTCGSCLDPQVPFTLRVLQDDVAPQTALRRVRVNREQLFVRIFPRAVDPSPSIGGIVIQCKLNNRRYRYCDQRAGTDVWRLTLSPRVRTGTHTTSWLVRFRARDAFENVDPTPLQVRVKVKMHCFPPFLGPPVCDFRRVRARPLR
jgi:hypothetical protein